MYCFIAVRGACVHATVPRLHPLFHQLKCDAKVAVSSVRFMKDKTVAVLFVNKVNKARGHIPCCKLPAVLPPPINEMKMLELPELVMCLQKACSPVLCIVSKFFQFFPLLHNLEGSLDQYK